MEMGKLLIAGRGEDVKNKPYEWVVSALLAVVIIIFAVYVANDSGYAPAVGRTLGAIGGAMGVRAPMVRTIWYYIILYGGIACALFTLLLPIRHIIKRAKLAVNVYERGVSGFGMLKADANPGEVQKTTFQLGYDKIAGVDTDIKQNRVSINAHGRIYTVIAPNVQEIAKVINSKLMA